MSTLESMSVLETIGVGILAGLLFTALRVVWVVWTTRLNGPIDYAVAALCTVIYWWGEKRNRRRNDHAL